MDKEGNISKYNAENTAAASAESTQSPSDIFFLINLYDTYHGIRKYYYITHKKETLSPEEIQALKTYYQEKWAISEENTLQALDENFIYTRENLLLENTSVVSLQKDANQMPQVVWIDYREANKKGFRLLVNGEKASDLIFPLKYNNLQTVEIKLQEPGQENSTEYRDLLVWKLPKKGEKEQFTYALRFHETLYEPNSKGITLIKGEKNTVEIVKVNSNGKLVPAEAGTSYKLNKENYQENNTFVIIPDKNSIITHNFTIKEKENKELNLAVGFQIINSFSLPGFYIKDNNSLVKRVLGRLSELYKTEYEQLGQKVNIQIELSGEIPPGNNTSLQGITTLPYFIKDGILINTEELVVDEEGCVMDEFVLCKILNTDHFIDKLIDKYSVQGVFAINDNEFILLKNANPRKIKEIEKLLENSNIQIENFKNELKQLEIFKYQEVYIAIDDQIILNEYFFFTGNKADILLYDKNIPEFNHELLLRRLLAHELKHIEFEFANPLSFIRWAVLRKYSITNRETDKQLEKIKFCDDHKSNKGNQACIHCSEGEAHEKHNPEGQACCQRACDASNQ